MLVFIASRVYLVDECRDVLYIFIMKLLEYLKTLIEFNTYFKMVVQATIISHINRSVSSSLRLMLAIRTVHMIVGVIMRGGSGSYIFCGQGT